MSLYKIKISERAENELFEIWLYLDKNYETKYADKIIKKIKNSIYINLVQFPEMGISRNSVKKGIRSLLVSPYIIFYTFKESTVTIRGIIHETRNYKKLF
jgi:toxin ParE1/3/4